MTIKKMITPKEKDIGNFSVRRLLPSAAQRMVGPWIFFDHMGPAGFPAGKGIDVQPHPHINLATVTYLFEGEIFHRDSLGNAQSIRPGDINLMVAGKGITHSERERPEVRSVEHRLHGLQLWHALPESEEETEPAFYHYPAKDLPRFQQEGVEVRLMMGRAYGFDSPVRTFAETLYLEAHMAAGQSFRLPESEELALYVAAGRVLIDGREVSGFSMAVLENSSVASVSALEDSCIAIIGGEHMSERYIEWNFVSSRRERIERAKQDWKSRRFPIVPGDEDEYIPLP
jgi:redox-sensitive bicupin YhaK (pirin superfamily)